MGFATEVGIDLGTANVLVYIKGKGIVLNEPSVVAINNDTDEILAVGEEARQMIGRTPANIVAARPLRDGVISDFDITERMLKYFIRKTCGSGRFFKPKIMVCVPSGVTEVEKRAVREAATAAGGKDVYLMEEPLAAAIGAGLDISKPDGVMVIDIGGGTTDIAVISLGGIVASTSVKMAGDKFDEAIIKHMRKAHKLYIGERTAEELKLTIGTAFPREDVITKECRGRDLVTGLPKSVDVTSDEIMEALEEPLHEICEAVHNVLERTPPELAADISNTGIIITGGGALMYG
ncbi:MAG: rod shape-determining protein MreB, partial [Firmicutes bacterium]|nr:rod shape-determining protein MreB [Bacillota bacterium]